MSKQYDKEKSKKNASRLKEIILTLRKYHLHRGFTPQKLYGILEDLRSYLRKNRSNSFHEAGACFQKLTAMN